MLFNSLQYLLFLPLVVAAFWLIPNRFRPVLLIVASYYFYMSWLKAYGLLLGGLTVANFLIGLFLAKASTVKVKRIWLVCGLALNLGCLALYKYTDFLIGSAWTMLSALSPWLPAQLHPSQQVPYLHIVLPLAISFFAFEFIHYLTDIFRGSKPIRSPVRFALFACFFPSQIAGPIKRYQHFDAQLDQPSKFDPKKFESGMWLILRGMFKKVALGDNLAPIVAAGFENATAMGTVDAWIAVVAFALQIYFDFSGYTDIGRGSARLMGFELPINFDLPYIARSLREFWHRWHISLSTWLRDYLYIPLGGSRESEKKVAANLMITMLLGGLWHGAAWTFVVWGGIHGVALVVNRYWDRFAGRSPALSKLRASAGWSLFSWAATMLVVLVAWVVFRADNMDQAWGVYSSMFSLKASAPTAGSVNLLFVQSILPVALSLYFGAYLAGLLFNKWMKERGDAEPSAGLPFWLTPPVVARSVAYVGISFLILGFASLKSMPFIYFQF